MQIETVRTNAFAMDFFRFGHGRETLVILPGLSVQSVMASAELIAEHYRLLTEAFTIYVMDRRRGLPPVYSVRDMARDTAEALRIMGLGPVCLFGASQGGMMAMEIAIRHPELVHRLALGSTAARVTQGQYRGVENWIRLAKSGNAADLYLAFGEALYPPAVFEQVREQLVEAAKTVTPEELERFVVLAEGVKGFDVIRDLGKIACPVLVLGSEDDQVLGGDASRQIAEQFAKRPDCELFMYDGFGHAAYDTAPDYKERILRFLAPQGAGG